MSDPATDRLAGRLRDLPAPGLLIRPVVDTDGPALTALVVRAYDEYACGPLDPEVFDADLARPATAATERGRRWWVVTGGATAPGSEVVGSVAHGALHIGTDGALAVEVHRLYLAPHVRGMGLASALLQGIAEEAGRAGADRLEAWSDTRLVDAHARYLALGFTRAVHVRELGDPAGTIEALFRLALPGTPRD